MGRALKSSNELISMTSAPTLPDIRHTVAQDERDQLIGEYLPLVHRLVERHVYYLPAALDKEDLVSAGIIGLIQAIDRYSPREGASLKTYVTIRVRGAILDELRRHQVVTRQSRESAKQLASAQNQLAQSLGREPLEEEIRAALDLDPQEFAHLLEKARPVYITSLDSATSQEQEDEPSLADSTADPNVVSPLDEVIHQDDVALVRELLELLSPQQLLVIKLFYVDGLRGKEIAREMKISASRVSQLHTLALSRLRSAFHAARQ